MDTMIKNIDEENWHFVKVQAAKEKKTIGELFNTMVQGYKEKEIAQKNAWERILSRKATLTQKKADEIEKSIKLFKKSYGFES
ncbi:hypothetical protein HZA99_03445 [Candidatus Woesearchaeota archaeon]|nr:hypothetical protein [Candidatus Woesearchaeota archaeon]